MATLRTDKSAYAIGDFPVYSISGAKPHADIAWTSFKNGKPTGELNAQYGQYTDANGNWSAQAAQAWSQADVGQWQKQALLINQDGSFDQAQVAFTVGAGAGQALGQPSATGDLFSGSTHLFGMTIPAPPVAVYAGIGLILYALLSGGGGRGR